MQETRQHILEILREHGQCTVDEIAKALQERRGKITAVTVRHHLNHLQKEDLITAPELLHRNKPGRPQHVYTLTDKAHEHFPNNYKALAEKLLEQVKSQLPPEGVNVIMEGVADSMASQANIQGKSLEERIEAAVDYLNAHGYNASWETCEDGYILRTLNCPYHHLAQTEDSLCGMDMRLVSSMVGIVPRMTEKVSDGDNSCTYFFPVASKA
jgi:predicted ArsR family transcriptional regulator